MRNKGGCVFSLLFFILVDFIESTEKIWKFDSDISNRDNWIDGEFGRNCKGIHFAPFNDAPVYLRDLTTPELTLPEDGEISIVDGGSIEFKDNRKCIKLKPINYHDWYDEDSWVQNKENLAIPHKQRIPCDHDDVEFPKGHHTRVKETVGGHIEVKSLKFDKDLVSQSEILRLSINRVGKEIFYSPIGGVVSFYITGKPCEDPYGCLCHHRNYIPCPTKQYEKVTCLEPIEPEDFCHEICGAYITFKPKQGFRLDNLEKKLNKSTVDTHASRVMDYLGNDVIQVVFTEKEYNGKSLEEADDFLNYLKITEQDRISNLQIQKSGRYYVEGRASPALSIVFGTLVGVVAFFAVLFYVKGDVSRVDLIINRFRLERPRGSLFNVPFFARFDNIDENLIIDGQSVGGSVMDISKSFDNPLYGKSDPPTTSTSTESQHENPLYEVTLNKEQEQDDVNEE